MTAGKERLDVLLVERGLATSRAQAQALIRAGQVRVDGQVVDKPSAAAAGDVVLEVSAPPRYASRGGEKLAAALLAFGVDPAGKVCLDVGASTGGFTDCLLQHGAARVYAVDVGRGQLDWKLRNDPRVVVREGLNARYLRPEDIGAPVDLATVDVSFISLRLILPPLRGIVKPQGDVVALVKPQFEAGRGSVRGGVVRDPAVHREVLIGIAAFAREELGWSVRGATPSPLLGPAGNREFFLHLVPRLGEDAPIEWTRVATAAFNLREGQTPALTEGIHD
ncbi:MAG: TlyA family RNA methyltransferase [Candidatus Acetothermia bacterium]|jgi:23S rRNA (cytidine1920-2'-O)/16S rRNA (cytidine1409-2'-O)-methyltransferase|nr:TlyA family RNA methyltransferase [Candidatus Acetothermia bacterium]